MKLNAGQERIAPLFTRDQSGVVDVLQGKRFEPQHSAAGDTTAALGHLPAVDQSALHKLSSFKPSEAFGSVENYAVRTDGQPVSQKEFAELYVIAMGKVSEEARRLVVAGTSREELLRLEDQLLSSIEGRVRKCPLPDQQDWERVQERHEQSIRQRIIEMAEAGSSTPEIQLRGLYQAMAVLGMAERECQLKSALLNGGAERLAEYREMMQLAREKAGNGNASDILAAYVDTVRERHGYFPALHVRSDYDGNLSVFPENFPESGGPRKPGERTNALINHLDTVVGFKMFHRLALTECAGLNPETIQLADQCYQIAARGSALFRDTPEFFRAVQDAGGEHIVFTANHWCMVTTKLHQSGLDEICRGVIGVRADHVSPPKPDLLLLDVLTNPKFGVYFFGEDNNSGTVKHILMKPEERAAVYQGVETAWLPDCMFFGARGADSLGRHKISAALSSAGVAHAVNQWNPESGEGLGGACELIRTYAACRLKDQLTSR